jgi:hypothetical protein
LQGPIQTTDDHGPLNPSAVAGLRGLDLGEEAVDLGVAGFGLDREGIGERFDVGCGRAGVLAGAGDP